MTAQSIELQQPRGASRLQLGDSMATPIENMAIQAPVFHGTRAPLPQQQERRALLRAFAASLSGTSLEFYDFAIFSAAAALYFPHVFFSGQTAQMAVLSSFLTYGVGYLSRPLGGLVFGRLGDRYGRKQVLLLTLLFIGTATMLVGLLPAYDQVGLLSPILLCLLRFAQGVALGGEWGSAVLITSERSKPSALGFWSSAAQLGPPVGTLLANGVLTLLTLSLTQAGMLDGAFPGLPWRGGWRLAFLISFVLVAFGLWVRWRLEESPVFLEIKENGRRPQSPIMEVFLRERRALAAVILVRMMPDVAYGLYAVFVLSYAVSNVGFHPNQATTAVVVGSALQLILMPLSGWLSDRVGRRLVYGLGALGAAVWTVGFFAYMQNAAHPSYAALLVGVTGGLAFHSLMYGPQAALIAEQFPPELRATGSTVGYTLAGIIAGGLAPAIYAWLVAQPHAVATWLITAYIAGSCLVTFAGLAIARASGARGR
jgi:MFS family permease